MIELIIPLIFLVILSYLDIKTFDLDNGVIPSSLTTSFIIIMFIITQNIMLLVLGLLLALFLFDLSIFDGMPDIKIFVATSLVFLNMWQLLIYALVTIIIGTLYKIILKYLYKKRMIKLKYVPFIPAMLVSYLIMMGVII